MQRRFARIESTPPAEPGFIGEGHTAVQVLDSGALADSDPFVLLMDDRLDIRRRVFALQEPQERSLEGLYAQADPVDAMGGQKRNLLHVQAVRVRFDCELMTGGQGEALADQNEQPF